MAQPSYPQLLEDNRLLRKPGTATNYFRGFRPHQDTWYFPRVCGTFRERVGWHGCQMPEQLLARIIRACSRPGELVLDPFAGSGTTLAVAKKLGRRWLGFEVSAHYVKQIERRLAAIRQGDPLEGPRDPLTSAPVSPTRTCRRERRIAKRFLKKRSFY